MTLKTAQLSLPAATADLAKLEIGTVVYLNGRALHRARRRLSTRRRGGAGLPAGPDELGRANFHCSPRREHQPRTAAMNVGAVTATASFRFAK